MSTMKSPCIERERQARGSFITTLSGAEFDIENPNVGDIPMYDIAHALSMNCRYNGHITRFYSVAEHSVIVSRLVPPEDALWGLLHDVTEAFVPDIPRPFKPYIDGFKEVEGRIHESISKVFGLSEEEPDSVFDIDNRIVADEATVLFPSPPSWVEDYELLGCGDMIIGLAPVLARQQFLSRFEELTGD